MLVFRYDNSFDGLLSAIFDAFSLKKWPESILPDSEITPLFATEVYTVITDNKKADRVSVAMKKRLPAIVLNQLTYVWFSEVVERGALIFHYLVKVFQSKVDISTNFADIGVLAIKKLAKKVAHERHYLMMFVRFKAINNHGEKVYFATVDPIYNTLPLVIDFFKDRFSDQKWAIFDTRRQCGYFYDLKNVEIIALNEDEHLLINDEINCCFLSSDEKKFQEMWYRYCKAITIKERINLKLQRQFMPIRFWKNLPEMNGSLDSNELN